MRIGTKLGLLICGLLVAQVATAGIGIGQMHAARQQLQAVVAQQQRDTDLALALRDSFQRQNTSWNQFRIDGADPHLADRHRQTFDTSARSVQVLLDEIDTVSTDPQVRVLTAQLRQTHEDLTARMRTGITGGPADRHDPGAHLRQDQADALALTDRHLAQIQLTANTTLAAQERRAQAGLLAVSLLIGILMLFLAVAARWVSGRIVRPILALTRHATETAHLRLPEATARIQAMDRHIEAPVLPSFDSGTRDELADLAGAFTVLQDRAVETAVRQRRTERDNADTLASFGRRNQILLARTLAYVGELETPDRDPGTLTRLRRLEHLVTRARRNAESMLVLAGMEQPRRPGPAGGVDAVLQAALAEIEDFTRVSIRRLEPVTVTGAVRAGLTHLLAELLENATQFSPAASRVSVAGAHTPDGYRLRILDSGLGMRPDLLAEANARIADPRARPQGTARLGHHIVGLLAQRHNLRVHLEISPGGGVSAVVTLPPEAITRAPDPPATTLRPAEIPLPRRRPPLPRRLVGHRATSDT